MLLQWQDFVVFYCCIIFHSMYTKHFLYHSSVDGRLSCFYILAIINGTAVNMGCIYLFELVFSLSFNKCPDVEFLGHILERMLKRLGPQMGQGAREV